MKITNLSLAAIAAVAMTTGAMADVDFKIGGQSVVYYQTNDASGTGDLFNQKSSNATAGLQLNANSDIGNGFGLGLQATALSSWGLENTLVNNLQQGAGTGDTAPDAGDYFAITKAYLTKKIGNTTLKAGRQELPKSLSPLAFSEDWNAVKNTFDAVVAINTDIADTTIVGAYVSQSNGHGAYGSSTDINSFTDLQAQTGHVIEHAYMLTVANKSIKAFQPTLSYYGLKDVAGAESGYAVWADAQIDAGLPVKLALQGGQIDPDNGFNTTKAVGAKLSGNAGTAAVLLAYSKVNAGPVAVRNVGTQVKTPLYTQLVLNQSHIGLDAETVVLKASMPAGPGKLTAAYNMTTDNSAAATDYTELDLMYKFDALGTKMFVAYVRQDHDVAGTDANNFVRFWSRYNF